MAENNKAVRKQAIFEAAYAVLVEKGYKGTSMLAVAKAAGASNETMYKWFGNKQGLLAAMIEDNAGLASSELLAFDPIAGTNGGDVFQRLERFGQKLIVILTGERAIALNRAAAADVANGGVLGELLAHHGRQKVVPLLVETFATAQNSVLSPRHDPAEIAEIYLALLIGDIQIRRVIGVTKAPDDLQTLGHAQRVNELIIELFGR